MDVIEEIKIKEAVDVQEEFNVKEEIVEVIDIKEEVNVIAKKRKKSQITSEINKRSKSDIYCLICQETGHVMTQDCFTCLSCGIKGHVRRDCPSTTSTSEELRTSEETVDINKPKEFKYRGTKEERDQIVHECVVDLVSPTVLAKKWKCNPDQVRTWVRKAGKTLPSTYLITPELEENPETQIWEKFVQPTKQERDHIVAMFHNGVSPSVLADSLSQKWKCNPDKIRKWIKKVGQTKIKTQSNCLSCKKRFKTNEGLADHCRDKHINPPPQAAVNKQSSAKEIIKIVEGIPKKPMSAFQFFGVEQRKNAQKEFPEASFKEIDKIVGIMWNRLEDKSLWTKKAKTAVEKHKEDVFSQLNHGTKTEVMKEIKDEYVECEMPQ